MLYYAVFLLTLVVSIANVKADTINLDDSMEKFYRNSPLVDELNKIRLENYSEKLDGTRLNDIEVEFNHNVEGRNGELSLTQPFRISDISLSRRDYKKNLNNINDLEKEINDLKIHHQFLLSYYDLYILQEQKNILEQKLAFLEKAKSVITKSINRNGMTQSQILAFDGEILDTRTNLIELKNNFRKMQIQFLQNIGGNTNSLILKRPNSIIIEISLEELLLRLDGYPSQYKLLLLKYSQAKYERKILQQDRFISSIEPTIGYGYDNYEKTDDFSVGLTILIPLWNRQSNKYSELKANEKYISKQLKTFDRISFQDVIKNAYNQLMDQIKVLKEYDKNIMPLYKKSINEVEGSFLSGQVSILDVWEIREKYSKANIQMLMAMKGALEIKNELELLIGNKLEDLK